MNNEFLQKLVNLLEYNQKFPKYQSERRVDIFFNLFLPDIIQWHFGKDYHVDIIIPELPIKKDENHQSTNLDYFAICNDQHKGFLIELKTDVNSCSINQFESYLKVQSDGFDKIKTGIRQIYHATNKQYREKYAYLTSLLEPERTNQDLLLEILYILPAAGKKKLAKVTRIQGQPVHFITLESLADLEVNGDFKDEWAVIKSLNLICAH
ncbi:MAG: hypothetical protein NTX61_07400 [Bacteroidetes bacterium]|nr:hypothetical protein [Bacteroidota bacterium]